MHGFFLRSLSVLSLLAAACVPSGSSGQCLEDDDCTGRGEVCNTLDSVCEPIDFEPTATEDAPPASFTGKAVPFFRGTVCTTTEVQTGSPVPFTVTPCLHPCLEASKTGRHSYYFCTGNVCQAWAVIWVRADSAADGCPEDAFGQFDKSECVWDRTVSFGITPELGGEPVRGTMQLEMPFLTNDDLEGALPDPTSDELIALIEQYPQDPERLVGPITMADGNPAPPESCDGASGCTCFEVGF